jgi:hypothetical protein
MLVSSPREYALERSHASARFYTIDLFGRTFWGWQRRDESGALVACSEKLFMDYVSCFCDAQGRNG